MINRQHNPLNPEDLVTYVNSRELGRTHQRKQQNVSDSITLNRELVPYIAGTSTNCRSTYLLRLDSKQELLAAAHGDRSVAIYCASSGRLLAKCIGHERSPWTLDFHPSQPYLASGCLGGTINIWNLEWCPHFDKLGEQKPLEVTCMRSWKHAGAIASLAFHPVQPILVGAWAQEVAFYDWVSGRKLSGWRFVSNQSRVRWVTFNSSGTLLYTATANPSTIQPVIGSSSTPDRHAEQSTFSSSRSDSSTSSTRDNSPSQMANNVRSQCIPRDLLLEFLLSQTDSWFTRLGVCYVCAVRLCRWASGLGPVFPTKFIDTQANLTNAARTAEIVAEKMRLMGLPSSRIIKEFLSPDHSSDASHRILLDANPAAVAIIEDMPVQEFLRSRGNYCCQPSVFGSCCGGHACDLVLTHRELMRHSVCRSCLTAFWKWASRFVDWWNWSGAVHSSVGVGSAFDQHEIADNTSLRSTASQKAKATVSHTEVLQTISDSQLCHVNPGGQLLRSVVGICLQCRAGLGSQQKTSSNETVAVEAPKSSSTTLSENVHSLPLAALELLRSRLSNANEATPVTYLAPDLVVEGALEDFLRETLTASAPSETPPKNLPRTIVELLSRATSAHGVNSVRSPVSKRRKLDTPSFLGYEAASCGENTDFQISTVDSHHDPVVRDAVVTRESRQLPNHHGLSAIALEAAELGHLVSAAEAWNRPRPIRLVSHPVSNTPPLCLFPYASLGSRLLRPTLSQMQHTLKPGTLSPSSSSQTCTEESTPSLSVSTNKVGCLEDVLTDKKSITACCRCGRIVPKTFPIDPQSSLSAVVCENLVLSDDPSTCSSRSNYQCGPSARCHIGNSQLTKSASSESTSSDSSQHVNTGNSSGNNMMYLIDRTSTDSMLNSVHRSITEVIAGLFVDMGEHGSANCLQDTTYRICCWELNLCGPVKNGMNYPPKVATYPSSMLPMPANVAVSYNTNSLVIPHARLFNDSSICLSRDGRMLAAFILNVGREDVVLSADDVPESVSSSDTLLAVYRLQPKARRGQCLFARRFNFFTPVCLDFSPLGDYLAVGMATTRLPSASLPSSINRLSPVTPDLSNDRRDSFGLETFNEISFSERHQYVAQILRLDRVVSNPGGHHKLTTTRNLVDVMAIKHPLLLNPVSSSRQHLLDYPSCQPGDQLDRWHRLLLTASSGISLNTILWNPTGGLFYGTTKGLVILMKSQPTPLKTMSTFPAIDVPQSNSDEKTHSYGDSILQGLSNSTPMLLEPTES